MDDNYNNRRNEGVEMQRNNIRAGWYHKWILLPQLKNQRCIKMDQVIRGPFASPRLVKTCSLIISSRTTPWNNLKTPENTKIGIPNPWTEYLALCNIFNNEIRNRKNYGTEMLKPCICRRIQIFEDSWKKLGLSFAQGIPDPWPYCNHKFTDKGKCKLECDKNYNEIMRVRSMRKKL